MIHFKLEDIDKIIPVGQEPNLYLSWFWLTYGDLWLTFGNTTIYEYTKESLELFGDKKLTPYNDYYIVRFLEDFTALFEKINENIPKEIFDITTNLKEFLSNTKKWLSLYEKNENQHSDFYFEEYWKLTSWVYQRSFDSAHLVGGPYLYFFRHHNKINIVWETEYTLENGITIWTAKNGNYEIKFSDFIEKVKTFSFQFFNEMDEQVKRAIKKDWQNITVDKERLVKEHQERKEDFAANLSLLTQAPQENTDWKEIEELYKRMIREIQ